MINKCLTLKHLFCFTTYKYNARLAALTDYAQCINFKFVVNAILVLQDMPFKSHKRRRNVLALMHKHSTDVTENIYCRTPRTTEVCKQVYTCVNNHFEILASPCISEDSLAIAPPFESFEKKYFQFTEVIDKKP